MNALQCIDQDDMCSLRIICTLSHTKLYDLEETDVYGNTALLKACYQGKVEAALILINNCVNLQAMNYFGQNALTLATYSGSLVLVQHLLRFRTYNDFNLSSICPALCVATLCQNMQLIEYFKSLDRQQGNKVTHTVHGLDAEDIVRMMGCQKQLEHAPSKSLKNFKI